MIILDTNVVSEMMRVRPAGVVEAFLSGLTPHETALTTITLHELRFGLVLLDRSVERRRLTSMLDALVAGAVGSILELDAESAEIAADLRAERRRMGLQIGLADALIAGINARHGATLATRNIRDFEGMGLQLVDPWRSFAP